ncbi:hypothetical protein [Olivibacter sitiensis]|uniref:hypothetical protein n=1 Tax=Olivibacter sitiensis TaxID=376470 RepID=UPI000417E196|nr:hypothetical protein [Olivibacter sitiensis]
MKQNKIAELSDEKLLKQKGLLKSILMAFGIMGILMLAVVIYIYVTSDSDKLARIFPLPLGLPIFIFPISLLPTLINLNLLNKEIKSRNLN